MRAERIMMMRFVRKSGKRGALLATAASAAVLLAGLELTIGPSAWAIAARDSGADMFANLQTVSDERLATERGKFTVGGFDINLGAVIKTLVNGQIALQTNLTSADGAHFNFPPPTIVGGALVSQNQVSNQTHGSNSNVPGPGIPVTFNNSQGLQMALQGTTGLNIQGVTGGSMVTGAGVVITDPSGSTFAGTVMTPTSIMNVIANTGNGRSITQQTQLTVTISNFSSFQQQLISSQALAHVMSSVQGTLHSFGH